MTTAEEKTKYLLNLRDARDSRDFGRYLTLAGGLFGLLPELGYEYVEQSSPHWVADPWLQAYAEELEKGNAAFSAANSYGLLGAIEELVRLHYQPLT